MRNLTAILITALNVLLICSLQASAQNQPEDQLIALEVDAHGTRRSDGSLFIAVTITQRAIRYEKGQPFQHDYMMYFQNHAFVDGDMCIGPIGEPGNCITISLMKKFGNSSIQKAVTDAQNHFLQMYEKEVKPSVESDLRERLKTVQPSSFETAMYLIGVANIAIPFFC